MKKKYEKPSMEITEFRFAEHIAASPQSCAATITYLDFGTGHCTLIPSTANS